MLQLVMFDADGVLFDSDESNVAYYNEIFRQLGEPPLDAEEEKGCVFLSAGQVFALRARDDRDKVAQMQAIATALDHRPFFRLLKPPFELRPFMLALQRDYRLALATNRSATIPGVVEHLNLLDLFDAIASAKDPVKPKPAPDILALCLERAKVAPEAAVYVGDSEIDYHAARSAGMRFVGVGARIKADNWIPALAELPAKLKQL